MQNAEVRAIARRLPKVQLHLHLDGSLPDTFVEKHGLPTREEFVRQKFELQSQNAYTQAKGGNWPAFSQCNSVLQTFEALNEATQSIVNGLVTQNCKVIELRFCPTLHTERGLLTEDDAVRAVVSGYREATSPHGIRGGIILCALRSYDEKHIKSIAQLAKCWLGRGVIGMDLAGDEASYPLKLHSSALAQTEVPLTIHAGEQEKGGADNIALALEIGARRIGHALALRDNDELCRRVQEAQVFVETCLTANCTGGGKVEKDRFDLHPIKYMLQNGVRIAGFNCDNLLLSGTLKHRPDPTEEIVRAKLGCGLTWKEIGEVLINGARASFDEMSAPSEVEDFVRKFAHDVDAVLSSVTEKEYTVP